jgi:adenylate cyclase class IV
LTAPSREVELKARVDDVGAARRKIEAAGAVLVFEGRLQDRIYDTPGRTLAAEDLVLRLRSYDGGHGVIAHLDWKGPTSREGGFKVRSELTSGVSDPAAFASILARLGYEVVGTIDRKIAQYELQADDAAPVVVRFEEYPRMDILVEVEGTPARIEAAIEAMGMSRTHFSADRLADFVRSYELRTGQRAAIHDSEIDA